MTERIEPNVADEPVADISELIDDLQYFEVDLEKSSAETVTETTADEAAAEIAGPGRSFVFFRSAFWAVTGFVIGLTFWSIVGFWERIGSTIFISQTHTPSVEISLHKQPTPASKAKPSEPLIDENTPDRPDGVRQEAVQACIALVLDRENGETYSRPCRRSTS